METMYQTQYKNLYRNESDAKKEGQYQVVNDVVTLEIYADIPIDVGAQNDLPLEYERVFHIQKFSLKHAKKLHSENCLQLSNHPCNNIVTGIPVTTEQLHYARASSIKY